MTKLNYEPPPPADDRVLPYATPDRALWIPSPTWLNRSAVGVALFILTLFALGLPPLAGAIDYTRDMPLIEAIEYAWRRGIRRTLDRPRMVYVASFAPIAVAGVVGFLYLRGRWPHRTAVAFNVLLPMFWLGPMLVPFMLIGPLELFLAIAGQSDGESWSDGFISYGAMGAWSDLWLAVALVLAVVRGGLRHTAAKGTEERGSR